jgi:hypothetical protein
MGSKLSDFLTVAATIIIMPIVTIMILLLLAIAGIIVVYSISRAIMNGDIKSIANL